MYPNCNVSVQNFKTCLGAIVTKHALPDDLTTDMLVLIKAVLPRRNKCPSGWTTKNLLKQLFCENTLTEESCKNGNLITLKFVREFEIVIKRNIKVLMDYANLRTSRNFPDDVNISPFYAPSKPGVLTLHLILNTDGVAVVHSNTDQFWPVFISIADLPPILRSSFVNIVMASLWYGNGKPDWDLVFSRFKEELCKLENIRIPVIIGGREVLFKVIAKVIFIVLDAPAKASVLNMKQFNGKFGCSMCNDPGNIVPGTTSSQYYPANTNFEKNGRTISVHSRKRHDLWQLYKGDC